MIIVGKIGRKHSEVQILFFSEFTLDSIVFIIELRYII